MRKSVKKWLMVLAAVIMMSLACGQAFSALTGDTCGQTAMCCPQDDPDLCVERYGWECNEADFKWGLCIQCETYNGGQIACFYYASYRDCNGDGVTDCAESCFLGWAWGPCPSKDP